MPSRWCFGKRYWWLGRGVAGVMRKSTSNQNTLSPSSVLSPAAGLDMGGEDGHG